MDNYSSVQKLIQPAISADKKLIKDFLGFMLSGFKPHEAMAICHSANMARYVTKATFEANPTHYVNILGGLKSSAYISPQPLKPELDKSMALDSNDPVSAKHGDKHISRMANLVLDIDRQKPNGNKHEQAATEEEISQIWETMEQVSTHLESLGFSKPLKAVSGNGCLLVYPIDLEIETGLKTHLKAFYDSHNKYLTGLGFRKDDCTGCEIDTAFQALRQIVGISGTINAKHGENRLRFLLDVPTSEQVEAVRKSNTESLRKILHLMELENSGSAHDFQPVNTITDEKYRDAEAAIKAWEAATPWETILDSLEKVSGNGSVSYWRRPGKTSGHSIICGSNKNGLDRVYNFSSSYHVLPQRMAVKKIWAYQMIRGICDSQGKTINKQAKYDFYTSIGAWKPKRNLMPTKQVGYHTEEKPEEQLKVSTNPEPSPTQDVYIPKKPKKPKCILESEPLPVPFLENLAQNILLIMPYPSLAMARIAALFIYSTMIGQSRFFRGLNLNIYVLVAADSGSGKDSVHRYVSDLFTKGEVNKAIKKKLDSLNLSFPEFSHGNLALTESVGSSAGSNEGTQNALLLHGNVACLTDECLNLLFSSGKESDVTKNVRAGYLALKSGRTVNGRALARGKTPDITNHYFTLLATVQTVLFTKEVTVFSIANGLLNRFFFVKGEQGRANRKSPLFKPTKEIWDTYRYWREQGLNNFVFEERPLNSEEDIFQFGKWENPSRFELEHSEELSEMICAKMDEYRDYNLRMALQEPIETNIKKKTVEKAIQLAALFALAENKETRTVEKRHWEAGLRYAENMDANLLYVLDNFVMAKDSEQEQRILAILRENRSGVTLRYLWDRLKNCNLFLNKNQFSNEIKNLVELGFIRGERSQTGRTVLYFLNE